MLVGLIRRIARGGLAGLCAGHDGLLFDEDICDEIVDQGGVDRCKGSRPQDDARGGQDLEGVQHDEKETFEVKVEVDVENIEGKYLAIKRCTNTEGDCD